MDGWIKDSGFHIVCSQCGASGNDIFIDLYSATIKAVCEKCGHTGKVGEE